MLLMGRQYTLSSLMPPAQQSGQQPPPWFYIAQQAPSVAMFFQRESHSLMDLATGASLAPRNPALQPPQQPPPLAMSLLNLS